jgi:hypothetical protein
MMFSCWQRDQPDLYATPRHAWPQPLPTVRHFPAGPALSAPCAPAIRCGTPGMSVRPSLLRQRYLARVLVAPCWSGATPWRDWKRRDRRVITGAAAHRGHTDGSRRIGGKRKGMPAVRSFMGHLPAPGTGRRGFETARLWRRGQGSNARGSGRSNGLRTTFIVPSRTWLCFEPMRKRTLHVPGSTSAWEIRPCPAGSRPRV